MIKNSLNYTPFGKLNPDFNGDDSIAWHSLQDHLIDVSACFKALCECRNFRRALETAVSRSLTNCDIEWLSFFAFLHDIGKVNAGFQAKRWPKKKIAFGWPPHTGHGNEGYDFFMRNKAVLETLSEPIMTKMITIIEQWGEDVYNTLLTATMSHHGRPINKETALRPWYPAHWQAVRNSDGDIVYDLNAAIHDIDNVIQQRFSEAFTTSHQPLFNYAVFSHLFAGLVQLADWLGSDTRFFPYTKLNENRITTADDYAKRAVATLGLNTAPYYDALQHYLPTFEDVFGNPPYPLQKAIVNEKFGSVVIVESETGSGKTEAAIWHFIHLFKRGMVDSLYFALPNRVSAVQMYQRIKMAVERLWPQKAPVVVRAIPGYNAADNQEPTKLPDFQVLWPDEPTDDIAQQRWAAETPKRFLAAPIAVGTIDQALLAVLQVPHAHLRYALLVRSLLVVDEVHASDQYMTALLERLLKAHTDVGGHALLLSATLGSRAKARYLNCHKTTSISYPSFIEACQIPYPVLSDQKQQYPIAGCQHNKIVTWSLHDCLDDPIAIAQAAIIAAATGAKVLVIRNTVQAAIAVFKAVYQRVPDLKWLLTVNSVATLHHSRFSREDRPLLDAAVIAQIGKAAPSGSRIVIGTQTLEQSLDLDADFLITDLCPMDVLLQRIGRLHRHRVQDINRPKAYQTAQAWVLTPSINDLTPYFTHSQHGLGMRSKGNSIYPDLRIIEATQRLIIEHNTITIPQDNRFLVEATTHPERLAAIEALGSQWCELGAKLDGHRSAQWTVAQLNTIDFDKPFDQLEPFPDRSIMTRFGMGDYMLSFDPVLIGPFGEPCRKLPIPHHLLPSHTNQIGLQPQNIVVDDKNKSKKILFTLGNIDYSYSYLGLEKRA
jgi:CRISPR-associated endonuclease/helicase Cas3